MRDLTRRRLLGTVPAALTAPALATSVANRRAAAADRLVRIGWLRGPNDLTLAHASGSLAKAMTASGATIDWAGPFTAAAPAFQALNAGSIDITIGSSTASITALSAGVELTIFGYQKMSAASEGILVKADGPIRTVADLAGKRVAVNRGGTGEYLLMRALETHKIDPATVRRIYLTPSDSGSAFLRNHIDAWAAWDPFLSIALAQYGARCLADGAEIHSDNAVTLVASQSFARSRAADLATIFHALQADNLWAQQHKDEVGHLWCREMGLDDSLATRIADGNAVPMRAVTDADVAQMGQIAKWYFDSAIIPSQPDVARSVTRL